MIVVVADDLTGAAEIAGVCLRYGLKVSFGIDIMLAANADVYVVATDSRSENEQKAYKIHTELAVDILKAFPNAFIFKKCDSVLRGHVLTELLALLDIFHVKSALIEPANPVAGRCIKKGQYYVTDELIENTGFATDPDFPATVSSVRQLVLQRTSYPQRFQNIETGNIHACIEERIVIPDCSSVDELAKIATLINHCTIVCGSAAFFEQILIQKSRLKEQISFKIELSEYLLVMGSVHPSSLNFRKSLSDSGCKMISFPDNLLTEKIETSELTAWVEKMCDQINRHNKVAIVIADKKVNFKESSIVLKQRLGLVVAGILRGSNVKELFVEGGASAYEILNKAQLKRFIPENELAPGVVRMRSAQNKMLNITFKPGSYMWPEKLFF